MFVRSLLSVECYLDSTATIRGSTRAVVDPVRFYVEFSDVYISGMPGQTFAINIVCVWATGETVQRQLGPL